MTGEQKPGVGRARSAGHIAFDAWNGRENDPYWFLETDAWRQRWERVAVALTPAEPAEARVRELERELEQYRSAARDHNDIWWKTVIGETHQPSGDGISVKHLHPLTVKPFYDQHKGTAIADIIAGLIFEASITRNRERFLVEHAIARATAAEAKLARVIGGLKDIRAGGSWQGDTASDLLAALQEAEGKA